MASVGVGRAWTLRCVRVQVALRGTLVLGRVGIQKLTRALRIGTRMNIFLNRPECYGCRLLKSLPCFVAGPVPMDALLIDAAVTALGVYNILPRLLVALNARKLGNIPVLTIPVSQFQRNGFVGYMRAYR